MADDEILSAAVRDVGGESYAGRLIGALRAVGRLEVAESVRQVLRDLGRRIDESNPFVLSFERVPLPDRSPVAARLRLLWADLRRQMLDALPRLDQNTVLRPLADILKDIDEGYVADSYHSLSIEGYRVSEELIRRVRDGEWKHKANSDDRDQKNALAASGYYRAYRKVRSVIEAIVGGADAGSAIAEGIVNWHRELFLPCVDAGLLSKSDLAGYHRGQVYIAGSARAYSGYFV